MDKLEAYKIVHEFIDYCCNNFKELINNKSATINSTYKILLFTRELVCYNAQNNNIILNVSLNSILVDVNYVYNRDGGYLNFSHYTSFYYNEKKYIINDLIKYHSSEEEEFKMEMTLPSHILENINYNKFLRTQNFSTNIRNFMVTDNICIVSEILHEILTVIKAIPGE